MSDSNKTVLIIAAVILFLLLMGGAFNGLLAGLNGNGGNGTQAGELWGATFSSFSEGQWLCANLTIQAQRINLPASYTVNKVMVYFGGTYHAETLGAYKVELSSDKNGTILWSQSFTPSVVEMKLVNFTVPNVKVSAGYVYVRFESDGINHNGAYLSICISSSPRATSELAWFYGVGLSNINPYTVRWGQIGTSMLGVYLCVGVGGS